MQSMYMLKLYIEDVAPLCENPDLLKCVFCINLLSKNTGVQRAVMTYESSAGIFSLACGILLSSTFKSLGNGKSLKLLMPKYSINFLLVP